MSTPAPLCDGCGQAHPDELDEDEYCSGCKPMPTWEITFTLGPGCGEQAAIDLYEYIEAHPDVSGALLMGRSKSSTEQLSRLES